MLIRPSSAARHGATTVRPASVRALAITLACAAALSYLCAPALAAPAALPAQSRIDPAAAAVLAKAKEAAGGAAWDAARTQHARVTIEAAGLKGEADSWDELTTGRHRGSFKLGPISGAEGWDGRAGWEQDQSGQTKRLESADETQGAIDEAYRRCLAYWYSERWPATIEDAGTRQEGGRSFRVVRITPEGGRPFEMWLDAATWLVDRTVEKTAMETRTVLQTDFRVVDGRKVAFGSRTTNGEPKYDQVVNVQSIEFNVPIDEAQYALPGPPPADFAFAAGKTATTVPFELINNHIYLQVKLNGRGPFRFLCDTGGANVITPDLAGELGVKPEGAIQGRGVGEKSEDVGLVTLDSLAVGGVSLLRQLFAVISLGPFADIEGTSASGLIGYEVFKRFVVRVDYEHGLLTITQPSAFTYQGGGTVVPFRFNGHTPQVDGSIDGIPGAFDIDTGSRGSLSLLRPFVEKNDMVKKLSARYEGVTGWGVGGPARGLLARAHELRLGGVAIAAPAVELSLQQKGAFSDPYVAGNVGAGALKRFNIVFDYAGQRMIFEPNANFALPDVYDRSGMWINRAGAALKVVDVTAGGPAAAAGLKAGDLVTAVDGKSVEAGTLLALRGRLRGDPPGTRIRLSVDSGGAKRDVELILKDLI